MTAPAIEIEGVTKRFGAVTALNAVSASARAGRLTGLVGPDGAGKTTLLRILAGLMAPTEGLVRMAGFDMGDSADAARDVIGYMPQRFGLYEDLTVIENLRLYARLRGVEPRAADAAFERLLAFTRLAPFTERRAGRLSGGMKQKLGLACALMGAPRVLLLDEPGVGVDPVSRQELWRMVGDLTDDGVAVVWSTAYLDEAERCADVIVLNEGAVAYQGAPEALTDPVSGRAFRLIGLKGDRRLALRDALDQDAVLDGVIDGDAVRVVTRQTDDALAIAAFAAARGGVVEPARARFEDAFVDLLGGGPGGRSALAERMAPAELDAEAAVEARGLTRRFGAFVAADQISFTVGKGEVFGLLGPNGAGKSTTFKMLCGLLRPSDGEALVAGVSLARAPSAAKAKLGYMAQKFSLYGLLSVRQNLAFSAGVYGLNGRGGAARIEEMIEVFQLGHLLDAAPDSLPLGYKQRLALACAVMHAPPVLFLDEPTSGVDPLTRREFWTHINGLVSRGVTVLVTTHFMEEAEYCDRVGLVHRGRLIALDAPDALKQAAARPGDDTPTMEEAFIALIEAADRDGESVAA